MKKRQQTNRLNLISYWFLTRRPCNPTDTLHKCNGRVERAGRKFINNHPNLYFYNVNLFTLK